MCVTRFVLPPIYNVLKFIKAVIKPGNLQGMKEKTGKMNVKILTDSEKEKWFDNLTYGYGEEALKKAFGAVCDPDDWRGPISALVKGEAIAVTVAAIQFYTATTPKVETVYKTDTIFFKITSEGYRNGPAGKTCETGSSSNRCTESE